MRPTGLLAIAAFALSACDPFFGLSSEARLREPVDAGCIDRAIRSVDGVGEVRHTHNGTTDFWYYGAGQNDVLALSQAKRSWLYSNRRGRVGAQISFEELDAFAPLMAKVNRAIEESCAVPLSRRLEVTRRNWG